MKRTEDENRVKVINNFITNTENNFKKYFPNGWFQIYSSKTIGEESITIRYGLIGNQEDNINGYRDNDPLFNLLSIYPASDLLNDDNELCSLRSGLYINPIEKYYAMSRVKTAIRKSKGSLSKLEKTLDNYFKKVAKIVIDNKKDIYKLDRIKEEYLIINI